METQSDPDRRQAGTHPACKAAFVREHRPVLGKVGAIAREIGAASVHHLSIASRVSRTGAIAGDAKRTREMPDLFRGVRFGDATARSLQNGKK